MAARRAVLAAVGLPAAFAACGMKLLQWNVHGECFARCDGTNAGHCDSRYPLCRDGATAYLRNLLAGQDEYPPVVPDFAAVEQLDDPDFVANGASGLGLGQTVHICGGEAGFGRYPFDIAVLYYDPRKWSPLDGPRGGCMERVEGGQANNYRAYVVQAFQRLDGFGERVVVAAVHYSHAVFGIDLLRADIQALMQQVETGKLVMLADTNRECETDSWRIVRDLLPNAAQIAASALHQTCCFPLFEHCYDRVMAVGFQDAASPLATSKPLGDRAPSWSAQNMHAPLVARLAYPGCESMAPMARLI